MNVLAPYDLDTDDEHFREGSRWPWIVVGGLVAVLLLFGAVWLWVSHQIDPPGKPGAAVQVRVEKGMSIGDIGSLLERNGVISSSTVFKFYVKLKGSTSVEAGDYTLHKHESMGTVLKILGGGAKSTEKQVTLTIPEGLTLKEIAAKVGELPGRSADRFMQLATNGEIRSQYEPANVTSLEGLILPETYFFYPNDDEATILKRMVEAFDQTANELNITAAGAKYKITPYQLVIVASMIEREAKVPEDRPDIAQVIYNRLAKGMRLQIDATVLYALGKHQDVVLFSDRDVDSPYNTYKVDGLPPGPIASPGRASLQAAVAPTQGTYLYYVLVDENGKHGFASTDAQFNQLLAEARRKGLAG